MHLFIIALLLFFSCTPKPEPFVFGKDACYTCKMGIVDPKFGSELVTKKGKVYKFDDLGCMVRWMKSGSIDLSSLSHTLVINFENQNDLLNVHEGYFVVGADIRTPMNFNTAAFSTLESAQKFASKPGRKIVDWKKIYDTID